MSTTRKRSEKRTAILSGELAQVQVARADRNTAGAGGPRVEPGTDDLGGEMSRVFLILYEETQHNTNGPSYTSKRGAAVEAHTPEDAIAALNGSYAATISRLRVHSVVEWEPKLMTKVIGERDA